MDRRKALSAFSEEDLLAQQEEFMRESKLLSEPATKCTRIQRKPAAGEAAQQQEQGQQQQKLQHDAKPKPAIASGFFPTNVGDVLGNIKERSSSASAPVAPTAAPTPGTFFPQATHRKQSKFALSRKAKLDPAVGQPPAPPSGLQHPIPTPAQPPAAAAPSQAHAAIAPSEASQAHVAPGAAKLGGPALSEAAGVSEENEQAIAAMGPKGVAEAVEELRSRISPQTLAFLANRRKKAAATAGAAAAGTSTAPQSISGSASGTQPTTSSNAPGTSGAAAMGAPSSPSGEIRNLAPGFLLKGQRPSKPAGTGAAAAPPPPPPALSGSSLCAPFGSNMDSQQPSQQQQQQQQQQPNSGWGAGQAEGVGGSALQEHWQQSGLPSQPAAGMASTAGGQPGQQAVDPRLVARVRFDLGAEVVGVQAEDEVWTEQAMLQRDRLRQDEGSAPQGYNISELLLLARSSLTNHRVAALHMLAAVLAKARPSPLDVGPQGQLGATRMVEGVQEALERMQLRQSHSTTTIAPGGHGNISDGKQGSASKEGRSKASSSNSVAWVQVWDYAVRELGIASHIRLALDDRSPGVCSAAAAAAAALMCAGPEEALALEGAQCCSGLGWPAVWAGVTSRPQASGTWEARRAVAPSAPAGGGGGGAGVVVPGVAGEEEETPEDVGTVDPVAGLMRMQVLPRLRYLLEVVQLRGAPAAHCLRVMCACAVHSEESAMAVVRCPRLLGVIQTLLLAGTSSGSPSPPSEPIHSTSSKPQGSATSSPPAPTTCDLSTGYGDGGGADDGSGLQLLAVMLLRLLCQASTMCAQLVRSSGILPLVQGHLVMGCAVAQPRPVDLLMVAESLRLWRVCAAHSVPAFSFDSLYPQLAAVFVPPSPPGAAASEKSASEGVAAVPKNLASTPSEEAAPTMAGTIEDSMKSTQEAAHQAPSGKEVHGATSLTNAQHAQLRLAQREQHLLSLLRWHVTREALALIDALVAHALALECSPNGGAHLGQPMISPGAAAALAAEAGRLWLGAGMIRRVAEVTVGQQEQLLLAADRDEWLQWHSSGTHPMLLLPPSFALTSSFAAALRFLATYWASVLSQHNRNSTVFNSTAPAKGNGEPQQQQQLPGTEQARSAAHSQAMSPAQAQAATAEVRGHLMRSGLLSASPTPPFLQTTSPAFDNGRHTSSSCSSPPQPSPHAGAQDRLALALLHIAGTLAAHRDGKSIKGCSSMSEDHSACQGSNGTSSSSGGGNASIGAAVACVWVEACCCSSSSMTLSSMAWPAAASTARGFIGICKSWCHQVSAAESLAALLSLGMVLQPLPPTPSSPSPTFPSSQISTTSPTHTQPPRTTSSDPGCSAAHLACAALPHLCASVSTLAQQHALSGCRVMGPWHLAAMQAMQPAVRLLLLLARLRDRAAAWQDLHVNTNTHGDGAAAQQDSIRTCAQLSTTQHDAHNGGFGAEDLSTTVAVVDASLAVLTLSPPGAETQCLDALRHATNPRRLERLLPGLLSAISCMHTQDVNLFAAAAGISARVPASRVLAAAGAAAAGAAAAGGGGGTAGGQQSRADLPLGARHDGAAVENAPAPAAAAASAPSGAPSAAGVDPAAVSALPAAAVAAAARAPYPPPVTLHAPAVSLALFDGYAAAWLSMVAAQRVEGEPDTPESSDKEGPGPFKAAVNPRVFHLARGSPAVDIPDGSRLPCPHTWMVSEALMLPTTLAQKKPQQKSQQHRQVHPVGAALAFTAALEIARREADHGRQHEHQQWQQQQQQPGQQEQEQEQAQCTSSDVQPPISTPAARAAAAAAAATAQCLQAALHACFVYDARQLLTHADCSRSRAAASARGASRGGREMEEEEEEEVSGGAWEDALARWSMAVLAGVWALSPPLLRVPPCASVCSSTNSNSSRSAEDLQASRPDARTWCLPCFPPVSWCTSVLAEKLATQFGTASYGDPLFGSLLAPLLLPGTASAVQRALWSGLAQEQALHLLPPIHRCLGNPAQYLSTPLTHPDVVSMLLRSLAAGEVHKALALGSVAGDVGVLAVLQQVCSPHGARDAQPAAAAAFATQQDDTPCTTESDGTGSALEAAAQPTSIQGEAHFHTNTLATAPDAEGGAQTNIAKAQANNTKAVHQAGLAARSLVRGLTLGQLQDVVEAGQRLGWSKGLLHHAFGKPCAMEQELATKVQTAFA